jgi:SAM-dependent methyltransferase
MTADTSTPSRPNELTSLLDLVTPMAIRVVATLHIADHLRAGPMDCDRLAARSGADASALGRVLGYLTARGIFAEGPAGVFSLNPMARPLLDDDPSALRSWLDLEGFGGRMTMAFFHLLATVREGRSPVAGHRAEATGAVAASYDAVMEAQARSHAPAIVRAVEWPAGGHVIDVGGGTGSLLAEILATHPNLHGTLVDLPETAAAAERVLGEAGLGERASIIGRSIFDIELPTSDCCVLKNVLHQFDDAEATAVLRRCAASVRPAGRVLVLERTLTADLEDRRTFTEMDLRMLILGGGRERTLEAFGELAAPAGLRLRGSRPTPVGPHVIEFEPAEG